MPMRFSQCEPMRDSRSGCGAAGAIAAGRTEEGTVSAAWAAGTSCVGSAAATEAGFWGAPDSSRATRWASFSTAARNSASSLFGSIWRTLYLLLAQAQSDNVDKDDGSNTDTKVATMNSTSPVAGFLFLRFR